jgi:hypothetical protein
MLLTLPIPQGTLAKNVHVLLQYYPVTAGATTLTITIPSPGLQWYFPWPIPTWNTGVYFLSQAKTGCVLRYNTPCPPGGGEVLVAIIH